MQAVSSGQLIEQVPRGESGRLAGLESELPRALLSVTAAAAAGEGELGVARAAAEAARQLLACDDVMLALWFPERSVLRWLIAPSQLDQPASPRLDLDLPLARSALSPVTAGQSLCERDLSAYQQPFERALAASGLRSRLAVPIRTRRRVIGLLAVAARQPNHYGLQQLLFLQQLAVPLALGLEQARLEARNRRQEDRLLGLQRVAQRLTRSAAGEDVLDLVLEEAVRSVGGDTGTLWLWHPERQVLVAARNSVPTAGEYQPVPLGHGVGGRAALRRAVVILNDYQRQSGDETPAGKAGVRAAIGAPLIADGELLGAVTANTSDPNKQFDTPDAQIFELLAGQASAVIQTSRLFEAERRQRAQVEVVRAVADEIARELDLVTLLGLIGRRATELVGADYGVAFLWDEDSETLIPRAWHGIGDWVADIRLQPGEGVAGAVVQRREAIVVNDYQASPLHTPRFADAEIGAGAGQPLLYRDRLVGVLVLANRGNARPFTEDHKELLGLFASPAAIAIENARLYSETTRRREQAEAMAEIARATTSTLELREVLALALAKVAELSGGTGGVIYLRDPQEPVLKIAAHRGLSSQYVEGVEHVRLGEGAVGRVAATGRPEIIADVLTDDITREVVRREGIRSVLITPLQSRAGVIGAMYVATRDVHRFRPEQTALFMTVGQQIAVAIENAELYRAANERARELELARQAAEEASRLKSEFVAGLSHELRTPLNTILGYSQLMLDGLDGQMTPGQTRHLSRVVSAAEHLLGLVNDLLDLSRIDAHRLKVRLQPLRLADVVQATLAAVEPMADAKGLELRMEWPDHLPLVLADPERTRQVLLNLAINAIKFTERGHVAVRARALPDQVEVTVSDTGLGIPDSARQTIFESFRQVDGSASRRHGGTGLGLAIVKQLLELMDGAIYVESEVGKGSRFIFTLPLARQVDPA